MTSPKLGHVVVKGVLELVRDAFLLDIQLLQVGMILLLLPLAYIYLFTKNFEPFHRGFYCNDQDLKWAH